MAQKQIKLGDIRIDGGTQPRVSLNEGVVADYAEAIDHLPPVTVYFDGSDYWLADGFHRYHAHRAAGRDKAKANVLEGTRRDAVLYSVGANGAHGLRRSNEDKRKSVTTLLEDAEWSKYSDNKIAELCAVSVPFVGAIRRPEVAARQKAARAESAKRAVIGLQTSEGKLTPERPIEQRELERPAPAAKAEQTAPKPKKGEPTVESLTAENEALRDELEQTRDNARELAALVESYDDATAGEHETAKAIATLRAQLRTVEATRDQWMTTANQLKREVKALQAKLKKAGAS